MAAAAAEKEEGLFQQGLYRLPDGNAYLGVLSSGCKHPFNVEAVFNGVNGLKPHPLGIGTHLVHERMDFSDVGRTHPASSVATTLVALTNFPEAVGQHNLRLGQDNRLGRACLQNGLYQILMFHSNFSL